MIRYVYSLFHYILFFQQAPVMPRRKRKGRKRVASVKSLLRRLMLRKMPRKNSRKKPKSPTRRLNKARITAIRSSNLARLGLLWSVAGNRIIRLYSKRNPLMPFILRIILKVGSSQTQGNCPNQETVSSTTDLLCLTKNGSPWLIINMNITKKHRRYLFLFMYSMSQKI